MYDYESDLGKQDLRGNLAQQMYEADQIKSKLIMKELIFRIALLEPLTTRPNFINVMPVESQHPGQLTCLSKRVYENLEHLGLAKFLFIKECACGAGQFFFKFMLRLKITNEVFDKLCTTSEQDEPCESEESLDPPDIRRAWIQHIYTRTWSTSYLIGHVIPLRQKRQFDHLYHKHDRILAIDLLTCPRDEIKHKFGITDEMFTVLQSSLIHKQFHLLDNWDAEVAVIREILEELKAESDES